MTAAPRLHEELADALGLAQAVRAAGAEARARGAEGKLARRLARLDEDLAALQERVNTMVVSDPDTRGRLTARSRRLRESEERRLADDADLLDALQALAAEAAYALAHWRVVEPLSKATGDRDARRLAKQARSSAEDHLELALKACGKAAKRRAKALSAA